CVPPHARLLSLAPHPAAGGSMNKVKPPRAVTAGARMSWAATRRRPCVARAFAVKRMRLHLRGERDEVAKRGQPRQSLALELPDALARQVQLVADRLERPGLALEPEAQLKDPAFAFGQCVECAAHALPTKRLLGLVEGVRRLAVGKQVAELALVVGAD